MRVRCSFCGAEYETAVTPAALLLVDRCERCGRTRLQPVDEERPEPGPPTSLRDRRDAPRGGRGGGGGRGG
jgi:hypothetical protein